MLGPHGLEHRGRAYSARHHRQGMAPLRYADAQIGAQAYGDKLLRVNGCEIHHTPLLQDQTHQEVRPGIRLEASVLGEGGRFRAQVHPHRQ